MLTPMRPTRPISEEPEDVFLSRLKDVVDSLGGPSAAARASKRASREAIYKWLAGTSRPPLHATADLCEAAGKSVDWLVGISPPEVIDSSFALIPRLAPDARASTNALNEGEDSAKLIGFRREWLKRQHIDPDAAFTFFARGDSMEPTIRDGDLLIGDSSVDEIIDNGIYAIVLNGLLMVKRVHMGLGGVITLISDNAIYPKEVIPKDDQDAIKVSGRIMWFGRSI